MNEIKPNAQYFQDSKYDISSYIQPGIANR